MKPQKEVESATFNRVGVSKYTGFSLSTIDRAAAHKGGTLPVVRIGRAVRFRRADVDAWLAERAAESVQETSAA